MLLDSIDRQILNAHRSGDTSFSGARMELRLATLNLKRELAKHPLIKWIEKVESVVIDGITFVAKKSIK